MFSTDCYYRFASIVYGRPCSINDLDCDVGMVENLEDTSATHPTLHSQETLDSGTVVPVSIMSYQRFKFKLYRITSPIIGNVYFLRGATKAQVVERVRGIHQELTSWFSSLPEELRLKGSHVKFNGTLTPIETTFKLQALALQLAYDNIMILLHRPLLPFNSDGSSSQPAGINTIIPNERGGGVEETSSPNPTTQCISKDQCWESAMRTSKILEHLDILRVIKRTHAAAYMGIHMFTAGLLLSILALYQPLSSQAQEAKKAMGRVIRLSKAFGCHTILSAQSGKVLESLVKVILAKEMKELLSDQTMHIQDDGMLATANPTPRSLSPTPSIQNQLGNSDPGWFAQQGLNSTRSHPNFCENDIPCFDNIYEDQSLGVTLRNTDFTEGLMSLHEGM